MKKLFFSVTLATLCAFVAVYVAYRWMETKVSTFLRDDRIAVSEQLPAERQEGDDGLVSEEEQIVGRNLFHAVLDLNALDENRQDANLEESDATLSLLGTVTGSDAAARAIIRDEESGKEGLYRLGDVVFGAKIIQIERDRIVLQTDEGPQQLTLKKREDKTEQGAAAMEKIAQEYPLLVPPDASAVKNSRSVPQALPGRRIDTDRQEKDPGQAHLVTPVRTGAEALEGPALQDMPADGAGEQ